MNLTLNHEGYEANLVRTERMFSGIHYMFRFENNYGASVMKHYGSYGHQNDLWELAVIVFDEDGEWGLTYNTEITDDIVEYLTDEEVRTTLGKIKGL